jgi:hypothetical protein
MLLSIVVPTKNRPATLYYAVQAALAHPSDDLEIVVQDCSDDNRTHDVLEPFADQPRLRYEKSAGAPSMTENWNLAFERVRGDYSIVLGDDDAVGTEIVNAARWARAHHVDAIADDRVAYFWPDYQLKEVAGTARLGRATGQMTWPNVHETLESVLRQYPIDPQRLPHIYHGLVRTQLMHEIKRRTGRFFDSLAPDYYSTVALSCIAKRFVRASYPVCVSGASAQANAGRVHDGKDHLHAREYRQQPDWPRYVPPVYCMITAITASTIQALEAMDRADLVATLDFSSLYAEFLAEQPGNAGAMAGALGRLVADHRSFVLQIPPRLATRTVRMVGRRLRQAAGRQAIGHRLKKLRSRMAPVDDGVVRAANIVEAIEGSQQILRARGVKSPFSLGGPPQPTPQPAAHRECDESTPETAATDSRV